MNNIRPVFPNHNSAAIVNNWRHFRADFADTCKYVVQCLSIVVSKLPYSKYKQVNTRRTRQDSTSLRGTKNESVSPYVLFLYRVSNTTEGAWVILICPVESSLSTTGAETVSASCVVLDTAGFATLVGGWVIPRGAGAFSAGRVESRVTDGVSAGWVQY